MSIKHKKLIKVLKYLAISVTGYVVIHFAIGYFYGKFYASRYTFVSGRPYGYEHCDPAPMLPPDHRTVRILVLPGGAINGILPLHILQYLQNKTNQPVHQLFDLIAATSTGSLIATGLTFPNPKAPTQALFNADAVLNFYNKLGPYALSAPWWYRVITFNGLLGPKYMGTRLRDRLEAIFDPKIAYNQLLTPTMIPVYDLNKHRIRIFESWICDLHSQTYHIHEILTAATATPGFFPPVRLASTEKKESNIFIDGAIAVNNPALLALEAAMKLYPNRKYLIVILDTGNVLDAIHWKDANTWGIFNWLPKAFALLLTSQQHQADNSLRFIQSLLPPDTVQIVRINFNITQFESKFDPSQKNLQLLKKLSHDYIDNHQETLNSLADKLAAEAKYN